MNSDFILLNEETRQSNESALESLEYTPAFLIDGVKNVFYPLGNKNFHIVNPFTNIEDIKTKKLGSFDTLTPHLKSETSTFQYFSKVYGVQYNESDFQSNALSAKNVTDAVAMRALIIEMDKEMWNGDNDGKFTNFGIKNNPYSLVDSFSPSSLEELYNSIIQSVLQDINDTNKIAGGKVTLFLSNAIVTAFGKAYGDTLTYWQRLIQVLKSQSQINCVRVVQNFITDGEIFYAVAVNDLMVYHMGLLPQIYKEGQNTEKNYIFTQYLRQSVGVQLMQKGSVIYKQITELPTK